MNCDEVKNLLLFYLDGEVTTGEHRLIKQHLTGCSPCQKELAALEGARSSMRRALQSLAENAGPSPQAWAQLQANLARDARPSPLKLPVSSPGPAPARDRTPFHLFRGVKAMRKKTILVSALAVVVVLATLAFFLAKNVTPVSAQQILDRAYAVQTGSTVSKGIEHVRTEGYTNIEALPGSDPGTLNIVESYMDPRTGIFRLVTTDARTGQVLSASGYDGTYTYTGQPPADGTRPGELTIYRHPQDGQKLTDLKPSPPNDSSAQDEQMFEQFRSDPNVTLSRETWTDGRPVYILRSQQQIKILEGGATVYQDGFTTLTFDAATYQMLEWQASILKEGQEMIIISIKYLANEILPVGTDVAWNFSDLQGVVIVDDPSGEHSDLLPETITQANLVSQGQPTFVLKTIPPGFDKGITAAPNQSKDQPDAYVVSYRNTDGDYFVIQPYTPSADLPQETPAGETYQTASGMVLRFDPPIKAPTGKEISSAIVTAPDGTKFMITSSLPLDQIKAWAEDIIPSVG